MKTDFNQVYSILLESFGHQKMSLNYNSELECLISVLLSSQTTDIAVNKITPNLFTKWKTFLEFSTADLSQVQDLIKSIGLYKTKAKNIIALARYLVSLGFTENKIPQSYEILIKLPGVGHKTATVVMNELFGIINGIAIDTHNHRIYNRLTGNNSNVKIVEKEILLSLELTNSKEFSLLMIELGRTICKTRPNCEICPLRDICKYAINKKLLQEN